MFLEYDVHLWTYDFFILRQEHKWPESWQMDGGKKDNKSAEKSLESSSLSVGSFLVLLDTYFMTSYCCTNMDGSKNN